MNYWLLILVMAAVTYVPRYAPMALAGRFKLSPLLERALNYVPIAVLSAIIAQGALLHDGQMQLSMDNYHALATAVAIITALLTRNLTATIFMGLLSFALLKILLPL